MYILLFYVSCTFRPGGGAAGASPSGATTWAGSRPPRAPKPLVKVFRV